MSENYLAKAIFKLRPNAEFSYTDDDYSTVKWDVLEGDAPTAKEVQDAIKAIKAEEAEELQLKAAAKAALLERLGITEEEARLLLGGN
jgi:hypothetical protein